MSKQPKLIETDFPFAVFSYEADHDYILARWVASAGGGFHTRAGFFAQQACEKYLKALTIQASGTYLETHRLQVLADEAGKTHDFLKHPTAIDDLKRFDAFEQVGRYGGAAKYDPLASFSPEMSVAGVSFWDGTYLHSLDRIVFNMRGRLNFAEINFGNCLRSIVFNEGRSSMEGLWTGQPAIREVLIKENAYFHPDVPQPPP